MIKKIKSNNKGFSLVELILAVLILGIVVSPLLHSFVTATNIFSKSRSMAQITAAGQNILETVDARPLKEFVEGGTIVREMLSHKETTPDFYELGISDYTSENAVAQVAIKNLSVANGTYDARVTFSRGQALEEDKVGFDQPENGFKLINSKELAKFSNMDVVFTQKFGKENPDEKLVNDMISLFPEKLGGVIDKTAGIKKMDRMIEIKTTVDEANTLIFVKLTYFYLANNGVQLYKKNGDTFYFPNDLGDESDEGESFLDNLAYEYNILPGGYDYSDDLTLAKDKNGDGEIDYKDIGNLSIFLMYYANYTGEDNIQISNKVDINLNTFIVKMNPLKPVKNKFGDIVSYERITGIDLNALETNPSYHTVINWILADEYAGDLEEFKLKKNDFLFTNAPINLYLEEENNYDSKIYSKENETFCLNGGRFKILIGVAHWYVIQDSKVSKELVKRNSDPRIYNVNIELFPVNSCTITTSTDANGITTQSATFSENSLYTLQGTKTN